jgi:hypothetical protein
MSAHEVRRATPDDASTFGRLLHAFNTEFDDETPAPDVIAERAAPLIASGEIVVLFAGEGPYWLASRALRTSTSPRASVIGRLGPSTRVRASRTARATPKGRGCSITSATSSVAPEGSSHAVTRSGWRL